MNFTALHAAGWFVAISARSFRAVSPLAELVIDERKTDERAFTETSHESAGGYRRWWK